MWKRQSGRTTQAGVDVCQDEMWPAGQDGSKGRGDGGRLRASAGQIRGSQSHNRLQFERESWNSRCRKKLYWKGGRVGATCVWTLDDCTENPCAAAQHLCGARTYAGRRTFHRGVLVPHRPTWIRYRRREGDCASVRLSVMRSPEGCKRASGGHA